MGTKPLPPWLSSALKTPNHSGSPSGHSIGQGDGCLGFIKMCFKAFIFLIWFMLLVCIPLGFLLNLLGVEYIKGGLPKEWGASRTPGYQYEFIPQTKEDFERLAEIRRHNQELLNRRNR